MIREWKPGDEKEIAALERACFSSPWSEKAIADSAALDTHFYIFEIDGQIAGYAGLQIALDEGYITNIAVKKEFRRRGIASALLRRLEEQLDSGALAFLTLEVRKSNTAAIRLYERLGYKTEGERRRFYEKPAEDALIMTKRRRKP